MRLTTVVLVVLVMLACGSSRGRDRASNRPSYDDVPYEAEVEEGLGAAAAVGDDRLQRQAQGRVAPESFTHGSSAQRVRWFKRGFTTGQIAECDTFRAESL